MEESEEVDWLTARLDRIDETVANLAKRLEKKEKMNKMVAEEVKHLIEQNLHQKVKKMTVQLDDFSQFSDDYKRDKKDFYDKFALTWTLVEKHKKLVNEHR